MQESKSKAFLCTTIVSQISSDGGNYKWDICTAKYAKWKLQDKLELLKTARLYGNGLKPKKRQTISASIFPQVSQQLLQNGKRKKKIRKVCR